MFRFPGLRVCAAIVFVCAVQFAFAPHVEAQATTVSASYVGGQSSPAASATIYFQPVSGCSYGSQVGAARQGASGGQIQGVPYTATVTSGAFSLTLPDALQASPNIAYAVTAINNTTGSVIFGAGLATDGVHVNTGGPYGCVQPSGATWNLDAFMPGSTAVTGTPLLNWRGAWSSGTAYNVGDAVSYNGSSFASTIAGNTNNPGSSTSPGTGWSVMAAMGASGIGTDPSCHTDGSGNLSCGTVAAGTANVSGTANAGTVTAGSAIAGAFDTVIHPAICATTLAPPWCTTPIVPSGTDWGAWITNAYTSSACPSTGCAIELPSGVLPVKSEINLSSLNKPVTLRGQGSGILSPWGTTLDWQGTVPVALSLTSYNGATLKDFEMVNDSAGGASGGVSNDTQVMLDIDGAGVNNSNHIVLRSLTFAAGSGGKASTAVIRTGYCTHAGCTGGTVPVDIDMHDVYSLDAGVIGLQALWASEMNLYATRFIGDNTADIQVGSSGNVVYNFQMFGGGAESDSVKNSNPILIIGAQTMGLHGVHVECAGSNSTTAGIYAPSSAYSVENLTIEGSSVQCDATGVPGDTSPFDVNISGGNTGQSVVTINGNAFANATTAAVHVSSFLLREKGNSTTSGLQLNDADAYALVSASDNLENTTLLPPQELIPSGGQKTWRLYGSGTNLAYLNSSGDFWTNRNLLIGGTGSYPTTQTSNNTGPRTATWPDSSGTVAWTSQLATPVSVTVNSGQATGTATVPTGTTGCSLSSTNAAAMTDVKTNGFYGTVSGTTLTVTLGANATGIDTFYALCK